VAGYTALGIAAATGKPVGVVVTSGTAVLNLAPAVAEAYLSNIPLLLLTADRPPEAIGQQDGQAIFQVNAFGANAKAAFAFPVVKNEADVRLYHRLGNEAALAAITHPKGPVQLNLPFAEPFYPTDGEVYDFTRAAPVWKQNEVQGLPSRPQLVELLQAWQAAPQRIIMVGTQPFDADLHNALRALLEYAPDVVLCADPTSNVASLAVENMPYRADFGLLPAVNPEVEYLILHLGGALTSRKLRTWLRGLNGEVWRVQPYASPAPDPFYKLRQVVVAEPAAFITKLGEHSFFEGATGANRSINLPTMTPLPSLRAEPRAAQVVLESLPIECVVHLSNSMPVRWAQWFWKPGPYQHVWCNRGASGIDGCTSTAVGYARKTDKPVLLLTGETAFLYDRNALWTGEPLSANLKIVVLNNGGGLIFRLIDGPANLPERDRFFENRHSLTAESAAKDFGLAYFACMEVTPELLAENLWDIDGPAIVEIFCDADETERVMLELRASK
jgi:2-succinyl-5-enolpyruvyl-6-hydroxy-3-cyclohexene-1-carboxylate synthase